MFSHSVCLSLNLISLEQTVDCSILCLVTGQSGHGLWTDVFWESTVCGLDYSDRHWMAALLLWECVGWIMGAGRRGRVHVTR